LTDKTGRKMLPPLHTYQKHDGAKVLANNANERALRSTVGVFVRWLWQVLP
jgi:hypothetical protein